MKKMTIDSKTEYLHCSTYYIHKICLEISSVICATWYGWNHWFQECANSTGFWFNMCAGIFFSIFFLPVLRYITHSSRNIIVFVRFHKYLFCIAVLVYDILWLYSQIAIDLDVSRILSFNSSKHSEI